MFSYKVPTRKEKELEVARIKSKDLEADALYWYDETSGHGRATIATNNELRDRYEGKVISVDGEVVNKKNQVVQEGNSCLLYGKSKFSISMFSEKNQVQFITLYGRAGSGKSWVINDCINNFIEKNKDDDFRIYCISEKAESEQFFNKKHVQYFNPASKEFMKDPITIEDIETLHEEYGKKIETLIVFDDTDALDKDAQKVVAECMAKLVKVGRSMRIHVIASSHTIADGLKSQLYHNQASSLIYFPRMNKTKVLQAWTSRYKWKSKLCNYLFSLPTRWIQIDNDRDFVLTENSCFQLSALKKRY